MKGVTITATAYRKKILICQLPEKYFIDFLTKFIP